MSTGAHYSSKYGCFLSGIPLESARVVVVAQARLTDAVQSLTGSDTRTIILYRIVDPMNTADIECASAPSQHTVISSLPALKLGDEKVDDVLEGARSRSIRKV